MEVIKGKKPRDTPIQKPKTVTLIINKKAAETIGLAIPEEILSKAEEVIE